MRVVVADGNRAARYGVAAALRSEPDMMLVGEAEDGCDAIKVAQELRPDVLVLSLSLPRVRGLEVIRELARDLPEVQVLVFSNETQSRAGALLAGAVGFVTKDAPEERLVREIRRVGTASRRRAAERRLGEVLLDRKVITPAHLDAALAWQRELKQAGRVVKLGELLVQIAPVSEAEIESALDASR